MSNQTLIANEVLAFIKHAIDYMDEVSIMQICKSSFKEDEISSAKLLLFTTLGKVSQMPSRRRDGTQKSVQDIITMFKETDPNDVPEFVAKDLHKLPPVTFDHVDVTRLLKDITLLKQSQAEIQHQLEVSNNTISDLRAEVVPLRNAISASRSPTNVDAVNVNTRREAKNASICSFESAGSNASPTAENACVATCAATVPASPLVETMTCVGLVTPKQAYAAIVAANKPAGPQISQAKPAEKPKGGKRSQSKPKQVLKRQGPQKDTCDKDGFKVVEKRKKKKPPCRNQCGTALTGPNMLLRPAIHTTLLYVSRRHHSTKAEEIVEYLCIKTKWTLRVERLEPRHNMNFNSFVVRVPTSDLEKFLKEDLWPKGVVFRRFRGRLRDTSQRNTTPMIRVQ
ncbi:uncharacterized protein LOC124631223 [Helicoverpa zea]|uniref:uncharacterized protein LOC124631223 n=1 Tax=Helicoverpa zea TaxID=7113 RepID=UPI001F55FA25|nr:uncharacterized protein LOC124631223 [Helicoverpa zea]